ncbi:MAG: hypothetical protein F4Z28_11290 [Gammaproteobacteria bacterium]|nr:hypothetical protein [Gammaproteobacteria bacterium]
MPYVKISVPNVAAQLAATTRVLDEAIRQSAAAGAAVQAILAENDRRNAALQVALRSSLLFVPHRPSLPTLARHQQRRRQTREIPDVDDILEWQGCYGFWNPDFPRP